MKKVNSSTASELGRAAFWIVVFFVCYLALLALSGEKFAFPWMA